MKKWMHYIDYTTSEWGGRIDPVWDEELVESGLRCPDGCGGIPTEFEGEPVTLRFVKKPTGMFEGAPRAKALHAELWRILSPHLKEAVVGDCEFVTRKGDVAPLEDFVSVYVPVLNRVLLRGRRKYRVCKYCGCVRCEDIKTTEYVLKSELKSDRVVMSHSRGILVDDRIRAKIEAEKFRSVGFHKYEVLEEPLDGRPKSLDDWPQLAKWRKPKKRSK